jgi:hypothetical protein
VNTMQNDSALLPLVKAMHVAKDRWQIHLEATGNLDELAFNEMVELRRSMHRKPPDSALDALLLLGVVRSLCSFAAQALAGEKRPTKGEAAIATTVIMEALHCIAALRQSLETEAGQTLTEMGYFTDGVTRQ